MERPSGTLFLLGQGPTLTISIYLNYFLIPNTATLRVRVLPHEFCVHTHSAHNTHKYPLTMNLLSIHLHASPNVIMQRKKKREFKTHFILSIIFVYCASKIAIWKLNEEV